MKTPVHSMPRIGIFWVYREKVFGKAVELTAAEEGVPGLLDSPDNHADVWEVETKWFTTFPELRGREYFEVPRGRVLWRRKDAAAIVYMDAKLFTDPIKVKISGFFGLTHCKILWETDPHYTT